MNKAAYIRIGVFVVALTTALIWGTLWLSAGGAPGQFDYYITYVNESVSGLSPDAALTYRGVNVGKVTDISIDTKNPNRVRLVLQVKHGIPIKQDTQATLAMQGLTGLATIDLLGGSVDSPPLRHSDDEPYPVIPSKPSLFVRFDMVVSDLLGNLGELSHKLNDLLDDQNRANIAKTLAHVEATTNAIARDSGRIGNILGDAEGAMKNARQASNALPELMTNVRHSTETLAQMADQLRAASVTLNRTAEAVQRTAQDTTSDVHAFAAATLPDIATMSRDLREAAENLRRISDTLERDPSVLVYGRAQPKRGPGE